MSKISYIVLFVVFGFFMMPNTAFACETKSEKHCCKKEFSSKKEQSACCPAAKDSKQNGHKSCNEGCKSVSCSYSSVNLGLPLVEYPDLKNNRFLFSPEKQNYYYSEIYVSSDFRSIWLPPKIG
nr:hypothetical protein [uncultured Flavobacterium sp.]